MLAGMPWKAPAPTMGAHHLDVLAVKRLRERRRGGERGDGEGGVAGESEDGAALGELLSEICPVLRGLVRFVVGEEGHHASLEQALLSHRSDVLRGHL